ncbi:MAG: DAK2 domain-containing protein [Roseburia sp.]|nr:DAK2 domain-containing protein [Roseburia sp.]MCM1279551.1 DAK2 domain-containing protein [Robinsoniella sp.]
MAVNTIDAKTLSHMFLAGAKNLEVKKEYINELNVFPVPDGDTGTNMTLTIMSAAKEVAALGDTPDLKQLAKAISSGSLRGARGNSGVILSQLFRGFSKVIGEQETLDIKTLSKAMEKAVESAYKAVMKPKEGTILTVAKGISQKAKELEDTEDLDSFMEVVITYGEEVLAKTPEMLPVLKQAGVVDSGGQGLIEVLKGCLMAYRGEEIDLSFDVEASSKTVNVDSLAADTAHIKYGYCTEFIIMLSKTFNIKHEMDFKAFLESIGDSIVVVADDDIVKVHVHTNDPGLAIQRALKYGALSNMKIDNMRLEHQEKLFKEEEKKQAAGRKEPQKDTGFISVSIGEGLNEILTDLGVDVIIEGGQTMNPSTEDILSAIEQVNAKNVFIFPNNKNIILAANQAQSLVEDKKVIVIPTKNIPQGITAIINYVPDLSVEENEQNMLSEISNVKTGQVTYAVRDTVIDEKTIRENDIMGIGDHGILAVGKDIAETTIEMVEEMIGDDEVELISIYYGQDVTEEEAKKVGAEIESLYSECDVELQFGGQPIYYYVISAE